MRMNRLKRLRNYTVISILLIALVSVCFYADFIRTEASRMKKDNVYLSEQVTSLKLNSGRMKLELDSKMKEIAEEEDRVEKLKEELTIEILALSAAEDKIESLVHYAEYMQSLCDANELEYVYYKQ